MGWLLNRWNDSLLAVSNKLISKEASEATLAYEHTLAGAKTGNTQRLQGR